MSAGLCWETKYYIADLESCHPSAFVHLSSSSRDRKRPDDQVCIGEAFSKLAKYERDRGKWKMLTRNVATYATIPIPQRPREDEHAHLLGHLNCVSTS